MLTISLPGARIHRIAVSTFFFIAGISFSSWASRIPDIKEKLALSDAGLGSVLLALPIGLMIGLPLAGWSVTRFGSKAVATLAGVLYPLALVFLGLSGNIIQLVAGLFLFGMLGNLMNISVNTQAVGVESEYGRSIMSSFHGVWSLAGFAGAGVGYLMVLAKVSPYIHFSIVCAAMLVLVIAIHKHALPQDINKGSGKQSLFVKPDKAILILGLIAFACMACEGAMMDWSGVYFKTVLDAPGPLGFAAYMGAMATGRFVSDSLINRLGVKFMLRMSGIVIAAGLFTAILLPYVVPATIGILLVGFGVSSVVPMVYGLAGKSKTMSPGVALAAVSSISFFGFLLGPPLIGFIAEASSLRWSFALIAVLGLGTTLLANKVRV